VNSHVDTSLPAESLLSLPPALLVGLGVVVVIELVLAVVALVDLARRPVAQVTLRNKWVWVAIILLVNLLGAILYLAIGRKRPAVTEVLPIAEAHQVDVADALYGTRDDGATK